jgi:adenosylcobinamide-GDP ribazoletransferase
LAAILSVAATVWITGAFHEDGLADTADALGGAHSGKAIHDILKDSRIGTYGGLALCLTIGMRTFALAELVRQRGVAYVSGFSAVHFLILVHALARSSPVALMAALPYVSGEGSKGSAVAKGGSWSQVLVSSLLACVMVGIALWWGLGCVPLAAILVTLVFVTWKMGRWFHLRSGGFTGDFLGATEQVLEISLMLSVLFALGLEAKL